MPRIAGTATVYFNDTRGSRFERWEPTAEMIRSAYYVDQRIELPEALCNGEWHKQLAEVMYMLGNSDGRVNGRTERSISVGDVVEVTIKTIDGVTRPTSRTVALSCERVGFTRIPDAEWWDAGLVEARARLTPSLAQA